MMMNIEELSTYELIETIRACQNEIEKREAEERNSAVETFSARSKLCKPNNLS